MNCPKCDGKLEPKTFKKVNINECNKCRGMWFDHDELKRAKDSTDEDLRWLDFDIFEHKDNKYSKSESHKICPKDGAKLESLSYSDSKVIIDSCSSCEGVWLDNHEFEKIITYLEEKVDSTTSGEYVKELINELTQMLRRPDHLASETKDFLAILKMAEKRLEAEHSNIAYALANFPIR